MEGVKRLSVLKARIREAERKGLLCPPMPCGVRWRHTSRGVKVVLLGQDPYHGMRQAHGLAFSVADPSLSWPPSLRNKERASDDVPLIGPQIWKIGRNRACLLNAVLTTEMGTAGAHKAWDGKRPCTTLVTLMARTPSLDFVGQTSPTHPRPRRGSAALRGPAIR